MTFIILGLIVIPLSIAVTRPADLPVLVFGQISKEDGSPANGAAFLINKYNPFTQAFETKTGGYNVGALKDSYHFSKIDTKPSNKIKLEFQLNNEKAETNHTITAEEYRQSFADVGMTTMQSQKTDDTVYKLSLHKGWNEFMLPQHIKIKKVEEFFQGTDYEILWRYNNARREAYKSGINIGEFSQIEGNTYYWIFINEDAVIEVE